MMIIYPFSIADNGVLTHTRGDTAQFKLNVQVDGVPLTSYNATFSVKQYPDDTSYLYQVTFNQSTPCIITHDLTAGLPYGTYWWDVQIVYFDSQEQSTQYKTVGAYPYILKPDVTS
jgi:predicted secreted hydrolase